MKPIKDNIKYVVCKNKSKACTYNSICVPFLSKIPYFDSKGNHIGYESMLLKNGNLCYHAKPHLRCANSQDSKNNSQYFTCKCVEDFECKVLNSLEDRKC